MATNQRLEDAAALMTDFAERTGVTARCPPRRYLWTDAFAVCNFLGLARATGRGGYIDLATRLIDQVHHVLGRRRDDDHSRRGWLSGAADAEGELHPTIGGLRIGKKLPERRRDEPFDETLEWDRDGQYFHYLTRWMHALDQAARATGDNRYSLWARELAATAHRAFTQASPWGHGVARGMVWKMSCDLSRALVPSMGHHDPLDGLVTYTQLETTAARTRSRSGPDLAAALSDFASLCAGGDWLTIDLLGLGGLLTDACRVEQLMSAGAFADGRLLDQLLVAALDGVTIVERSREPTQPASRRLAFRELGLVIGFRGVELLVERLRNEPTRFIGSVEARLRVELLARHLPFAEGIQAFWRNAAHRDNRTWSEHRDINEVMLATSLVPDGFLSLAW